MPQSIVDRAKHILSQLEQHSIDSTNLGAQSKKARKSLRQMPEPMQLSIFEANDPVATKLKEMLNDMDVNSMTPIEAMMKLNELKGLL